MATRPVYRPNPSRGWRGQHGRKMADAIDGRWSYENLMTENDDGQMVDPRGMRSYDVRYDLDGDNR